MEMRLKCSFKVYVLACGHELCFDCTLELSNAAISHDGIFGYGTEKENLAAEKEYAAANAKGHRPCPTCKKMMEMNGARIFKVSAFEPSDEELDSYVRKQRREKERRIQNSRSNRFTKKERSTSPTDSILEELDDSNEDLPDVANIFDSPKKKNKKGKKKARVESDGSDANLTYPRQSGLAKLGKRVEQPRGVASRNGRKQGKSTYLISGRPDCTATTANATEVRRPPLLTGMSKAKEWRQRIRETTALRTRLSLPGNVETRTSSQSRRYWP